MQRQKKKTDDRGKKTDNRRLRIEETKPKIGEI